MKKTILLLTCVLVSDALYGGRSYADEILLNEVGRWNGEEHGLASGVTAISLLPDSQLLAGFYGDNDDGCLVWLDVSDAANMAEVARYQLPGKRPTKIVWQQGIAYLVCGSGGFLIVRAAEPDSMAALGAVDSFFALDMAVLDTVVYIGGDSGILAVNISDVDSPVVAYRNSAPRSASAITVLDTLLFVGSAGRGFEMFSVFSPLEPASISRLATTYDPVSISVTGSSVYLGLELGVLPSLYTIDVSDLREPKLLGSYPDAAIPDIHQINDMVISGSELYAATRSTGVMVFDVSDATAISRIAYAPGGGQCWDIAISDRYIFEANGEPYSVRVFERPVVEGAANLPIATNSNSGSMFDCRSGANKTVFLSYAEGTQIDIEIVSPAGRRCFSGSVGQFDNGKARLELGSLAAGAYRLVAVDEHGRMQTSKVVLE